MMEGVTNGFEYEMKIVHSHFPIKTSVKGDTFVIENFLGERSPRKAKILGDTKIQVKGNDVLVTGTDLEKVSQTAANIERATVIKGFDSRVFQDGIYITKKERVSRERQQEEHQRADRPSSLQERIHRPAGKTGIT